MDAIDSPNSSVSTHTPLQDESVNLLSGSPNNSKIPHDLKPVDELADEQLDYEDFDENNESKSPIKESNSTSINDILKENNTIEIDDEEDGECDSDVENVEPVKVAPKESEEGECESLDSDNNNDEKENKMMETDKINSNKEDFDVKIEEESVPHIESPWERGLRLARERREMAKQKKAKEKDTLREKQLHINLDQIEEVEPIVKPVDTKPVELNQQMLKALQPIVVLPEEAKPDEMICEYYLSESDYQHRTRFIPSKLYTLDPWEVEEWKRELDQIKCEIEAASAFSNNIINSNGYNNKFEDSVKASFDSRRNIPNRMDQVDFKTQTSQYAINKTKLPTTKDSTVKPLSSHITKHDKRSHDRHRRDLPTEHKNRLLSKLSRSSSASSKSSKSSSSTVSSRKKRNKKKQPASGFKAVKKPALGRDVTQSSDSGSSSSSTSDDDSSSSSGDGESSSGDSSSSDEEDNDGASSTESHHKKKGTGVAGAGGKKKTADGKQYIRSVRPPKQKLHDPTKLGDKNMNKGSKTNKNVNEDAAMNADETVSTTNDMDSIDTNSMNGKMAKTTLPESDLPSANSRPGVKLKLISRNKPIVVSSTKSKEKTSKKTAGESKTTSSIKSSDTTKPSSIFGKPVIGITDTSTSSSLARESALAATQLEMQQEFLRNYKDKIAIYRSQLSHQQQKQQLQNQQMFRHNNNNNVNSLSGGSALHPHTLTHQYAPPIKGPITVMTVTSKKTGPPKYASNSYNNNDDGNKLTSTMSNNYDKKRNNYSPSRYRKKYNRSRSRTRSRSRSRSRNKNYTQRYNRPNNNNRYNNNNDYHNNNNNRGFDRRGSGGNNNYNNNYNNNNNSRYNNNRQRTGDYDRGNNRHNNNNSGGGGRYNNNNNYNNRRDNYSPPSFRNVDNDTDKFNDVPTHDAIRKSPGFFTEGRESSAEVEKPINTSGGGGGAGWPLKWDNGSDHDTSPVKSSDPTIAIPAGVVGAMPPTSYSDEASTGNRNSIMANTNTSSNAAPSTSTSVPKEKRREELLKQLKAVEDAIAKKRAKIDK